ncbi:PAP2-domain-containing protein [Coniochaeta ligniaria NRRL 30616]|uniref:Dolichyldiphosphatase n=1 Tax=Coniochaeta ligniaria NRRL 30616 TaxID=1408157 RepID=A0A1J7JQ79_9PEZI|nr:PAP2-domain-containing protein [Coniochaeta ligniaria NRRL 30616]
MADDITPLASLSLTHVYYDPSDPISYLCAFLALVPQALCVVYATLMWSTREAEVILMFAGQMACEAFNFALKRLIKEERPPTLGVGKGYGMPSSHAQFAVFWAVALGLFLVVRHKPRSTSRVVLGGNARSGPGTGAGANVGMPGESTAGRTTRFRGGGLGQIQLRDVEAYAHQPWSLIERVAVSAVALVLASMVAGSRIYLGYHTPKQVLAGCLAGFVCAIGWFAVTYLLRQTGFLAQALNWPVVRWFRIRDLVIEEDMCQAGWEKWEEKRLAAEQLKKN